MRNMELFRQRKDPWIAQAIALWRKGMTQEEIAPIVGMGRTSVSYAIMTVTTSEDRKSRRGNRTHGPRGRSHTDLSVEETSDIGLEYQRKLRAVEVPTWVKRCGLAEDYRACAAEKDEFAAASMVRGLLRDMRISL